MRKKSLFHTVMLTAGIICAVCSSAQGSDISLDMTAEMPTVPDVTLSLKGQEAGELATADVVAVNGSTITVDSPHMHYELELDPAMEYFCLTQDYEASRESYELLNDGEAFRQVLVDYDKHLYLGNYAGVGIWISDFGSDPASLSIQDLTSIAGDGIEDWLQAFQEAYGYSTSEIVDCGGKIWFRYDGTGYMYIANGQYVWACWTGTADMTDADAADMQKLLSGLTLAGR